MQTAESALHQSRHFRRQPNAVNHACAACLRRECPASGECADAFAVYEAVTETQALRIFFAFEQGLDSETKGVRRLQHLTQTHRLILS